MDNRKTTWPFILGAILLATLCSGFIFDWGKKKTKDPNQTKAAAIQDNRIGAQDEKLALHDKKLALQEEKLASQDETIASLNRKIDEQNKQLVEQEKKLSDLAEITKKIDELQASLKTNKVDINESDMSQIQELIEKQMKLNISKRVMPKAGVVSVRRIFRDCKRSAKYRQESNAERQQLDARLTRLENEIQAQTEGLKTLKIGSENYLTQVKEIMEKQANLKVQQEFHKQQLSLKEQRITEEIYGDILRITGEIAKQKSLDWVFEISEPELPASSPTELELSMGMHKLLYGGGCLDITEEVMTILDSNI
jgi:uncharacterized coiled-coil protein SlyX